MAASGAGLLAVSRGGGHVAQAMLAEIARVPGTKRLATLHAAARRVEGYAPAVLHSTSPAECDALLAGVRDLVLLPTLDLGQTDCMLALVTRAAAAGVERVHFVSRVGAELNLPVCLVRWAGRVEAAIRASGLAHTILRCAPFTQGIRFFLDGAGDDLRLVGPFRDTTLPWLDARDVGEIIAGAAMRADGSSTLAQLGGPDEVGLETVAGWLGEALGRRLPYEDVSLPEMEGLMTARGFDPRRIRTIAEYWDYVVSGAVGSRPCPTVAERLGHPPRGVRDWTRELAAELTAAVNPA